MSVRAGEIVHVGGNSVLNRLQSAGLGDVRVAPEIIREVGNPNIVDKVPGDPDFTFSIETFDVSIEPEAWLAGEHDTGAGEPGSAAAAGARYRWKDMRAVN